MSRGQTELDRAALVKALNDEAGRKSGTATILYQLAIADRMGLSLTDLVCGEILSRTGAITAGELAELSGLTTGAITGVADRLEKAGFVRRLNDPNDRRRIMLEPLEQRFDALSGNPYDALEKRFNALYAEYSDQELALVLEFLRKSVTIFDQEATRLREKPAAREQSGKPHMEANIRARMDAQMNARMDAQVRIKADLPPAVDEALLQIRNLGRKETRSFSAPRGTNTEARLDWESGAVHLRLKGARAMSELYRAEFKYDIPIVRDQDGNLSVQYRHRTVFGRGGGEANVQLNTATAWDMHLNCGASHIEADFRDLSLRGLNLVSRASKLELQLPAPVGTVKIRLENFASYQRVSRPVGVPVRLEFEGEYSALRFDHRKMVASNEIRESPEYKRAANRYEIEFIGGAGKIEVHESKG